MLDPTITQNSALYFVQHRPAKRRFPFFSRLTGARKERLVVQRQQAFDKLVLWHLLHRADKR